MLSLKDGNDQPPSSPVVQIISLVQQKKITSKSKNKGFLLYIQTYLTYLHLYYLVSGVA